MNNILNDPTPTEAVSHAIQIQLNIRQYKRFLRLIENEIESGSIPLIEGTKAKIQVLLAIQNATEEYFEGINQR